MDDATPHPDAYGVIRLTIDPVRHPETRDAVEGVLGAALPDYGALQANPAWTVRVAPCEWWLVLAKRHEAHALLARMAERLSGLPAIITDASDGLEVLAMRDPANLSALTSVELKPGEAAVLSLAHIRSAALCVSADLILVVVGRSRAHVLRKVVS